jgi:hypothetical protein
MLYISTCEKLIYYVGNCKIPISQLQNTPLGTARTCVLLLESSTPLKMPIESDKKKFSLIGNPDMPNNNSSAIIY